MFHKHISLLVVLSLIVPILFILPIGNANADAPFTSNVLVNSSYTTGDQITPRLCVESNTTVHAVWEDIQDSASRIFYAKSINGGASFGARVRVDSISSPGSFVVAENPALAVNSTHSIFVVWSDNSTGTYRIYLSNSDDDGGHFSPAVLVTSTFKGNQTRPSIAIDNDIIYMVWAEFNQIDHDIKFATLNGVAFSTPIQVDTGPRRSIQQFPVIAVQGTRVFVAWHDSRDDGLFDIYGAVSNNKGVDFGNPKVNVEISHAANDTEQTRPAAIILPDGRIVVIWQDGRNGNLDIYSAISTNNGVSFGTNFKVSDDPGNGDQSDPSICSDARGVVSIAYRDNRLGEYHISSAYSNNATSYAASIMVNDDSMASQRSPAIEASPNGTALVGFSDNRAVNQNIYLSQRYNQAPSCLFDNPVNGSTLGHGRQEFEALAADPESYPGLIVQIKLVSTANGIDTEWMTAHFNGYFWNITVDTAAYPNGDYIVQARSYDGAVFSPVVEIAVVFDNGAQAYVDLTITSSRIKFDPASPVSGQTVFISAEVWNLGNSDASGVEVRFSRDSTVIGYIILDTIAAGNHSTAEVDWTAQQGTFVMKVDVDPLRKVDLEANYSNNNASKQLVVAAAPILEPDLEMTSQNITLAPTVIHVGDVVNITAKIYNSGKAGVAGVPVLFEMDTLYFAQQTTDWIPPVDARIVYQTWTATLGQHTLTVNIDPMQTSNDSNFTNNVASVQLTVVPASVMKPDIAISNASLTVSPQNPVVGANVTFSVLVSNVGDQPASNVKVSFYLDGQPLGDPIIIPQLMNGENPQDVSINWTATLGNHGLLVKVDEQNAIAELNETNNTAYATFLVHQVNVLRPNLSVSSQSIVLTPDPAVKGKVLKFNVTVTNLGNGSATNVLVLMKVDGTEIASPSINYIGPGESRLVVGQWIATGGDHTFTVIVDPNGIINESSEADNQASVSFSLPADPVSFPWEWILLAVALVVLGLGAFSYLRAKKGKQPKQPEQPK